MASEVLSLRPSSSILLEINYLYTHHYPSHEEGEAAFALLSVEGGLGDRWAICNLCRSPLGGNRQRSVKTDDAAVAIDLIIILCTIPKGTALRAAPSKTPITTTSGKKRRRSASSSTLSASTKGRRCNTKCQMPDRTRWTSAITCVCSIHALQNGRSRPSQITNIGSEPPPTTPPDESRIAE